jgi:protein TonB
LVPISTPQPEYPAEARRTGVEGEVVVSFMVNTDGSVGDIKIIRSKPLGVFNLMVKNAIRHWRFQPIDQPQSVTRTITYKLSDQ